MAIQQNWQKFGNCQNQYKLLEIQPAPSYLILIPWTYHLFLECSILNIYHRAMKLCSHKEYL